MRLDVALVAQGLARSRNQAANLIAEGLVTVDGEPARRSAQSVTDAAALQVAAQPWVSRAAYKLIGALDESGTVMPRRVLDAGSSTGGFTQICLARGAEQVHAIDVGHDQLAPELRRDPRVVVQEGRNLRHITLDDVGCEPVELVVADISFISLRLLLRPLLSVLTPGGVALLLVKPQFEVGRGRLGSGGVVRSKRDRTAAVDAVVEAADQLGWRCNWRGDSVLPGADGNRECFIRLTR